MELLYKVLSVLLLIMAEGVLMLQALREGKKAGSPKIENKVYVKLEDEDEYNEAIEDKQEYERNDWNNDRSICSGCNDL